jgi:hypothetical protein
MAQEREVNILTRTNLIVCGLHIGAKRMKQLFTIVLSTAAICAFASATPAAAQVAADTQDQTPYTQQSDRTQAYTASSADPANGGCSVIDESRAEGGHSEHTAVCPSIP